jgi:putative DNA primase/helicase
MSYNNSVITLPNIPKQKPITCEYANGYFRLTNKGLSFIGKDKESHTLNPLWICSPLHVLAKTRDAKSGAWGRLLEWQDDDAVTHQWAMPLALLQGDASDVRRELANLGLAISPNRTARDLLASYLQVFPVEARARCVDRLGWHDGVFVTSNQAIGQSKEKIVFQNTNTMEPALSYSGTTDAWRKTVARLASGNSRLMFALSTAFAPTLARLAGEDSGGFHFRGASSSGKSTALCVAASVWGNPKSYCRLWRTTSNGLEGLAALHNDGLLILDELSQLDPKAAGEAAYLLANGQGKTRASRSGTAKQSSKWSLFFLSAGEESLSALMARTGQRTNAGQEIRLADIEADAGCGMGMFETLHDEVNAASMALSLKKYANQHYGAVGKSWLEKVVANRQTIGPLIADTIQRFAEASHAPQASGQISRVARRFALVAAAGELATHYGLTGWLEGEVLIAVRQCFLDWQDTFGMSGNRESRALMAQVRAFFESHGASRFDKLRDPNAEKIHNRAGFYLTDDEGYRVYMVLSEVFKHELCKGFDYRSAIKTLIEAGWLKPAPDGKTSHKPRVRGIGTPRLYVFTHKIWEDE